jgi:hypothetical protein
VKQRDWERDIELRQRNIVFPDTNLNAARFYRNLLRTRIRLSPLQRAGVGILAVSSLVSGTVMLAVAIAQARDGGLFMETVVSVFVAILCLVLGWLLVKRALNLYPRVKRRRENKSV